MLYYATMAFLVVFGCTAVNYITGQSMVERPLVVGLIAGLLMGDMTTGILIGASLEAIFMGNASIGGVISAELVTATTLTVTFAVISHVDQQAAITLSIPIGMLAAFVVMLLKNVVMNIFAPLLDKYARENNQKGIVFLHYFTWLFTCFAIASMSFIGVLVGNDPVSQLVNSIPTALMNGLKASGGLLPAVGFALLMKLLWNNKLAIFYLLGFILTAYLKLPAVAVAALGVVICVVMGQRDLQFNQLLSSGVSQKKVGSNVTKEDEEDDFLS